MTGSVWVRTVGHSEQAVHHQQQHEDTPEEIGKRIASQWTHDPEAVGRVQADEEEAEEEAAEEVIEGHEVMEEEALEAAEEEEEEEVSQEDLSDVVLEPLGKCWVPLAVLGPSGGLGQSPSVGAGSLWWSWVPLLVSGPSRGLGSLWWSW